MPLPDSTANHGIAGTSIVCADRNDYGMTGIVDEAAIRFVSVVTNGGLANSLLLAGTNSQPGDVVMVVMMFLLGQIGGNDWVPYEILQPVFDATLTVTANGRYVVAAGGNGANNLDDPRLLRRFDLTFRDSGAFLAGASDGALLTRAPFSNFGSRIDANSWGNGVMACGYGTLFYPNNDPLQAYTLAGTGTSSATALLAGVVTSIVGGCRAELARDPTIPELRQLMAAHGAQSPDPIGRRPDVHAILQAMGAIDGLETSAPDVGIGGTEHVLLSGPTASGALVFANFAPGSTDLGLNRRILLDLPGMMSLGFVAMPTGSASIAVSIPADPGLHGVSLYFQAGILSGSAPVHVTNAGQLTVR
ncbi:MAG: S8 family serine peptidase [Planctomycetota bacterium]